jgi:PAS domain S-box-containing protein
MVFFGLKEKKDRTKETASLPSADRTPAFASAIIALVVIAIGVIFSLFFSHTIEQFVWRVKTEGVFHVVRGQASLHLRDARFLTDWPEASSQDAFRAYIAEMKTSLPNVAAVKIFNAEGVLVATDAEYALIGRQEEGDDVSDALTGVQKIESAESEIRREIGLPHLLEIYTPIFPGNTTVPDGVVEVYFNIADLTSLIRQLQLFVLSIVSGGLIFIFLLLHIAFRKQSDRIGRQAKELAAIIEKSPYGIMTINKDGVIDSFNPTMTAIAGGKNNGEKVGLRALEYPPYKTAGLHAFFRQGLTGKSFTAETRQKTSGGKDTVRRYVGVPIFGADEKTVDRLLLMVEDITERKRLEAKLAEHTKVLEQDVEARTADLQAALAEAQKLSSVVENSFESVIITDADGTIRYVNPTWEQKTGWKKEEVVGKTTARILKSGVQGPEFYEKLWKTISAGEMFRAEVVNRQKDGTLYDVDVVIFPLVFSDGKKIFVEISRDITERKRAEVKIKELNELRNKFIRIVSHQLRTPLNSIRWNLETLLADDLGKLKKEQKEFIRVTHDANVEVIHRIHDLLAAMDIEEGRVMTEKEETLLENLWGSVMVEWKKKCEVRNLVCKYVPQKKPLPSVALDAEKMREVFEKLVDNAVTYTPEKGRITATLRQTNHHIRFEITDTGIGIPEAEQTHIFTRFFRATNAPSMKPDASGLGLSIAKYYVEQHGGTMGFTSEEGNGSTFWFEIPMASV